MARRYIAIPSQRELVEALASVNAKHASLGSVSVTVLDAVGRPRVDVVSGVVTELIIDDGDPVLVSLVVRLM